MKVYSHLSAEERIRIDELRNRDGLGVREIARRLGRAAPSVKCEIDRNTNPDTGMYEPNRAQRLSERRLARPKTPEGAVGAGTARIHPVWAFRGAEPRADHAPSAAQVPR